MGSRRLLQRESPERRRYSSNFLQSVHRIDVYQCDDQSKASYDAVRYDLYETCNNFA